MDFQYSKNHYSLNLTLLVCKIAKNYSQLFYSINSIFIKKTYNLTKNYKIYSFGTITSDQKNKYSV